MNEIIYGIHPIQTLLNLNPQYFLNVYISKKRFRNNLRLQLLVNELNKKDISIKLIKDHFLDLKTYGAIHQGIAAQICKKNYLIEHDLPSLLKRHKTPLLLILDNITDPHNLGACLRNANAAGVHLVIIPRNKSAKINATVRKVACGAADIVPLIRVTNLARILCLLKKYNIKIVGTVDRTNNYIFQSELTGPLAIVVGAENKGMRNLTKKYCDEIVSIPTNGIISTLNVSVAAGICLFEAIRQRINNNLNISI